MPSPPSLAHGRSATHAILTVVSALLVASCGAGVQAPAAVVDGYEISQVSLEREAERTFQDPQVGQQIQGPAGEERRKEIVRQLLLFLIQDRVVEDYARANDLRVTRGEIDRRLEEAIEQTGGQVAFEELLEQRNLPIEEVRDNIARVLLFEKVRLALTEQAGGDTAPDQVFNEWLRQRLASGDVEVNPRFGRIDPQAGAIAPITSTDQ